MIQTSVPDGRGGRKELNENDLEYWNGPYRYVPFPKAVYRATETAGETYQHPEMKVVQSQEEFDRLGSDWKESPDAAREVADQREAEYARIAAERNASDLRMSEKAQAEALKADRATDAMLPAIPETPVRRHVGWPKGKPRTPKTRETPETS